MRISDWSSDVCSSDLTALRNVQPLYADLATGGFAIAHNGNLSNAMRLRRDLVRSGSIFQSTSDTETIIHLVATSSRSEEHTSELQSLMRISYAVFCLKKKTLRLNRNNHNINNTISYKSHHDNK